VSPAPLQPAGSLASFATQAQWARQKLGDKLDLESPRLLESPRGSPRPWALLTLQSRAFPSARFFTALLGDTI
jgi:hypothetical protein